MTKRFEGKAALVTGAGTGIGRGIAQAFAREGAAVLVTTRANVKAGQETVELIRQAGGRAEFFQCDVSKEKDVEAMVQKCVELYGRLDFAANNAGVGPDGVRLPVVELADYTEELWDAILDTNLKGAMFCMKYEIRQMKKQQFGVIVNTSSVGAITPAIGFSAYNASKAGLNMLTKGAALETAKSGIRVNCIMPGLTNETLLMKYLTDTKPNAEENFKSKVPLGRIATPQDMADAVVWLCSEQASFITGLELPVDGGLSMGSM